MLLTVLIVKYSAPNPSEIAKAHLAISLPVEVSPSFVDSPKTSSLVVPPSEVGEGEASLAGEEEGEDDGDGLGEGEVEGDGEGEAS